MIVLDKNELRQKFYFIFILALVILEQKTYISMYFINEFVKLFILIGAVVLVSVFSRKKPYIGKEPFVTIMILMCIIFISTTINMDDSFFWAKFCLIIVIAFSLVASTQFEFFAETYTKVLAFICVYSVIVTYLVLAFPDLFSNLLPTFSHIGDNNSHMRFVNALFTNVYIPDYGIQFRNFGPFNEPGRFQFYIVLAMIFEAFIKEQVSYKRLIVFFVTLITTTSTTGIVCGCAILISIFNTKGLKKARSLMLFMLIVVVLISVFDTTNFGKELMSIFEKFSNQGSTTSSFQSRWGSAWGMIQAWLNKPLFGWGYSGLYSGTGSQYLYYYTVHNTNTSFTIFAAYGIMFGIIHLVGVGSIINKFNVRRFSKLLILIVIFLEINSENFMESVILFSLMFYGLHSLQGDTDTGNRQIGEVLA